MLLISNSTLDTVHSSDFDPVCVAKCINGGTGHRSRKSA